MKIDHIHFYVENATHLRDWLIQKMGFQSSGQQTTDCTHTEIVATNQVLFRISSALNKSSPVAAFLAVHPPGVADVAFFVDDLDSFSQNISSLNINIIETPTLNVDGLLQMVIQGWGNFRHTIIANAESPSQDELLSKVPPSAKEFEDSYIIGIDHVVLNVPKDQLTNAAKWYQDLFGWRVQQSFDIQTAHSGLYSQALIDSTGQVQFNINEPSTVSSQIQTFLDIHGGAGIQHVALHSRNIFQAVDNMQQKGLNFLSIPVSYYHNLKNRSENIRNFPFGIKEWHHLEKLAILLDWSGDNAAELLLQIFTQPIFNEPTFFFEIIERRSQAQGFGEGNFMALFQAMEQESLKPS
jgi:4-hydroxyphenylpyruvate dioxygenase